MIGDRTNNKRSSYEGQSLKSYMEGQQEAENQTLCWWLLLETLATQNIMGSSYGVLIHNSKKSWTGLKSTIHEQVEPGSVKNQDGNGQVALK